MGVRLVASYLKSVVISYSEQCHLKARSSSKFLRGILDIENRSLLFALYPIVFEHASVDASILTLKLESWGWRFGIENEVVVAMRAILVTARNVQPVTKKGSRFHRPPVFEFLGVFSKAFLAFLTCKGLHFSVRKRTPVAGLCCRYHVKLLQQLMVFLFNMAFRTVEPFTT